MTVIDKDRADAAFEGFFIETDGRFLVYCEKCKTLTARPITVREVAGLCGMSDIVCDVCHRTEDEVRTPGKVFIEQQRDRAAKIRTLHQEMETEKKAFVARMVADGWKAFEFSSTYYGSHSEYGEGDVETTYLFHPNVDISRWDGVSFSHGHHGQNESNDAFDAWLESLKDDQYVEM